MSDHADPRHAEVRLWKELGEHQQGMLGVVGGTPHHFRPMTQMVDKDNHHALWFFTRTDAELLREAEEGKAMFILQSDKFQACIGGRLHRDDDKAVVDKFWNPIVASWYPEGKDDPHLAVLRFDLEDAELWLNEAGLIRFVFETAKANLTKTQPDVGDRASLNLN